MVQFINLRFAVLMGMITELAGLQLAQAKDRAIEEPTPVVGVRGLEKDGNAGRTTSARDYKAIDRLEKISVSADELKKFRKDGKLD